MPSHVHVEHELSLTKRDVLKWIFVAKVTLKKMINEDEMCKILKFKNEHKSKWVKGVEWYPKFMYRHIARYWTNDVWQDYNDFRNSYQWEAISVALNITC